MPKHSPSEYGSYRVVESRISDSPVEYRAASSGSDFIGELHGYAAVFNSPTEIQDRQGTYMETIAPGAFKKTIEGRMDKIVVQFDHGTHQSIGSLPLGRLTELREDARGLYVSIGLADTSYNSDLMALVRAGALSGQSFRFAAIHDTWDDTNRMKPTRTLKEVKLFELGPVVFPAYDQTSLAARNRTLTADAARARIRLLRRKSFTP